MNIHSKRVKRVLLVLTLFAGIAMTLRGQAGRQLYLVTGFAANNAFPFDIESKVFAVDESKSAAHQVAGLADQTQGSSAIRADYDRRLIVIATPSVVPTRLVVLSMDAPTQPRTINSAIVLSFLCNQPGMQIVYACGFNGDDQLWGIDVTDGDNVKPSLLADNQYRFVRTEGFWSPADLHDYTKDQLSVRDGKLFFQAGSNSYDLGVPKPPNVGANDRLLLDVSNDDMFVIGQYVKNAGGFTVLIYDKKGATWNSARFDGDEASLRGFGSWIVTGRALEKQRSGPTALSREAEQDSPGASFRMKALNPLAPEREQISINTLFRAIDHYFPGALYLYNIRSRQKYTIQTGQGDSEILLVDGNTVYYRVNDTLYRASIGQTSVGTPVKILSDANVQMVHWAFFGPLVQ